VISLFILAVHSSNVDEHWLAHIAHVEMYIQKATGRSGNNEAARFEEAGYAVSALQAALQFFLDERRGTGHSARPRSAYTAQTPAMRTATTSVFSSYLQPGASVGSGGIGGEMMDNDRITPIDGLVRSAREQSTQNFGRR